MNLKERYWDFISLRREMRNSLPVLIVRDSPREWVKNPTTRIIAEKLNKSSYILDIGA